MSEATHFFVTNYELPLSFYTTNPNSLNFFSNGAFLPTSYEQSTLISNFMDELAIASTSDASIYLTSGKDLDLVIPSTDNMANIDVWSSYNDTLTQETLSIPDVKLYYPEPFIASPSLVHSEIWFIHILHYQY
jgi:hypothetical protein